MASQPRTYDPLFAVHRLNREGLRKAEAIAIHFNLLLINLNRLCPEGRELSIVKTKLEEAAFFARKAMATQAENQERLPEPVPTAS